MNVLKKDQVQIMLQVLVATLLFRFVLFETLVNDLGLSKLNFFLYLIALAVIMYGGVLLYRIVLQEEFPDKHIQKNTEKAYYSYLGVNVVGIVISFFVSSGIEKTYYFGFFLALAAIIYLYITQWRKILVFDNVVYALIISFPFFMLVMADLMPSLQTIEVRDQNDLKSILLNISLQISGLLWLLYFVKTILIDLKFMELDIKHKRKSLATLHGREIGAKRTTFLSLIPLVLIIVFCLIHLNLSYLVGYVAVAVILPYLFYLSKLWKAKSTEDFNSVNNILNIIIWLTIFSIVVLFFQFKI
ncbi:hypothetical protein H1R17_09410 [Flavobacterium sp. xlx-214]|uniref:hypothetical protein n=1 Tax=unclassified Flavobacterium TaxID=196869 RepID=UPI0013D86431|nr:MULTISPECIES: hypothetical protein [unclassified Flavobacterium]MBA5793546.1 hypothetical protein [Flavobacterium sp. xlx-221]QMI82685.1 hypothetical protein H1R17_09410 [Flavobacterium sp. xlx-214]